MVSPPFYIILVGTKNPSFSIIAKQQICFYVTLNRCSSEVLPISYHFHVEKLSYEVFFMTWMSFLTLSMNTELTSLVFCVTPYFMLVILNGSQVFPLDSLELSYLVLPSEPLSKKHAYHEQAFLETPRN